MYFVYILYSETAKCKYTGYTENLEVRLQQHNVGSVSKFTRKKGPWKLIHFESFESKREALIREKYLKTGVGRDYIKMKTGY